MTKTDTTKVLFRTWIRKDFQGSVDAIFPEVATDYTGAEVLTYSHVGQHSAGDRFYFRDKTRPATPREYAPLKKELESLGYVLDVVRKITPAMDRTRRAAARNL